MTCTILMMHAAHCTNPPKTNHHAQPSPLLHKLLPPSIATQHQCIPACACPEAARICGSESAVCRYAAADGVQYMRDLCMTLCYFLQAYPSGAQLLLQGQASIVTQLTSLHDDLVPQMARAVTSASQHNQRQAAQVSTCTCMQSWASF